MFVGKLLVDIADKNVSLSVEVTNRTLLACHEKMLSEHTSAATIADIAGRFKCYTDNACYRDNRAQQS